MPDGGKGAPVRPATPDDAAAIARVQVDTWRSAYAGIFPAAYLDSLNDIRIASAWADAIERPAHETIVAEDLPAGADRPRRGPVVVGFAYAGPADAAGSAEIFTLYVLATHQRRGIGRRLVGAMARTLSATHSSLVIRVLVANAPARAFYERLGGTAGEVRPLRVGGREIDEIAYHWPDLPRLSAALSGA